MLWLDFYILVLAIVVPTLILTRFDVEFLFQFIRVRSRHDLNFVKTSPNWNYQNGQNDHFNNFVGYFIEIKRFWRLEWFFVVHINKSLCTLFISIIKIFCFFYFNVFDGNFWQQIWQQTLEEPMELFSDNH